MMARTLPFLLAVAMGLMANLQAAEPLIVAHRGLLRHAPENTLANFRACLELRLGFEFDVERTQDGQLVCIHDDTVDRTTNGSGRVADLTLAKIRTLDAGSWFDPKFAGEKVPTVDEVLRLVAAHSRREVWIAVDLKAENVGPEVVRLAEQHGVLHRLLFIGRTITDPQLRARIRAASGGAQTAAVANNAAEFAGALAAANAAWVYLRFLPTKEQVEAIRRAGKRAFIAGPTVAGNLPANWRRAAGSGLNAILTDYPLELRTTLRAAQTRVPAPVKAKLVAKRSRYVLPKNQRGDAFRKRIQNEKDPGKLPPAQAVDLVLELKNVSRENVMIWPRGSITYPDLEVKGPGVIGPENLGGAAGGSSGTSVQPTIAPGKTHRIKIKSLNPGGGTPFTYWCEPGVYSIQASYLVYTGLPPFPFPGNKAQGKPRRFIITAPPVKVRVVLAEGQP